MSGAGEGGGGVGEQGVAGGVPAGAGEGEGADDEGGFLAYVVGGADGAGVLVGLVLVVTAKLHADVAQEPEGDRAAAGFGEEVAAEAEHVGPAAQPCIWVARAGFRGLAVNAVLAAGVARRAGDESGVGAAVGTGP